MLSAQISFLTSSHDANVPFGMEAPWGHRNKNIQRHKLYLKIQNQSLGIHGWLIAKQPFVIETIVMHDF